MKQKEAPIEARSRKMATELSAENGEQLCSIMKSMLQLNPYFRMSAYECLMSCKVFDAHKVRCMAKEGFLKKLFDLSFRSKAGKSADEEQKIKILNMSKQSNT